MDLLTVDKSIFKFRSSPHTTLVLLSVLVRLPVAVLAEGRPEVERINGTPGFPVLVARLLKRWRDAMVMMVMLRILLLLLPSDGICGSIYALEAVKGL